MTDGPTPDSPQPAGRDPARPRRDRRSRAVGWGTSDILRAAALIIVFYLLLRLVWFANSLVFIVFLGILFGLAISVAVDGLERWRIPRGVGAALTAIGFFALLAGFGALMAPTLHEQGGELRRRLPEAIEQFEGWVERQRGGALGFLVRGLIPDAARDRDTADATRGAGAADSVAGDSAEREIAERDSAERDERGASADSAAPDAIADDETVDPGEEPGISFRERLTDQLGGVSNYFFRVLSSTIAVISGLALIIFLAIFIAADPDLYHRGLLHLFPHQIRRRIGEVSSATASMLRRWLLTQLIGMVVIGVVTTVALLILGVESAFALGLLAGLLEFIPTIGPVIAAVPAVAMGFLDSPQTALYVAIAYLLIQFLESNLLMPMLMHEGVNIPPAMSIVFQALMAILFGFLGLVVAVPLLAAALVPIKMLYVEDVVGDEVTVPGEEDDDEEREDADDGDA
jgi:predicted PurR-regulated permease PerM